MSTIPKSLREGLVIEYFLNGNVLDTSGNSNDGSATNLTYSTDYLNRAGRAGSFNGTSSTITTTSMGTTPDTEFTINVWVMFNSVANRMIFVGKIDNPITSGGVYFGKPAGGGYEFRTYDTVSHGLYSTSGLSWSIDTWYMVTGTVDSSKKYIFYRDGVEIASTTGSQIDTGSRTFAVGSHISGTSVAGLFVDGKMFDVRLWNRALTLEEIKQLYIRGIGTPI